MKCINDLRMVPGTQLPYVHRSCFLTALSSCIVFMQLQSLYLLCGDPFLSMPVAFTLYLLFAFISFSLLHRPACVCSTAQAQI
jgi:hypothetical protein